MGQRKPAVSRGVPGRSQETVFTDFSLKQKDHQRYGGVC